VFLECRYQEWAGSPCKDYALLLSVLRRFRSVEVRIRSVANSNGVGSTTHENYHDTSVHHQHPNPNLQFGKSKKSKWRSYHQLQEGTPHQGANTLNQITKSTILSLKSSGPKYMSVIYDLQFGLSL
jgi:hypothetical protein